MQADYNFDWSDLAFASKKPLKDLHAIFIAAPRELSKARFKQLIKEYLPKGNVVLGLAKEPFIDGFEDQPQFRTLQRQMVHALIAQVNASASPHKIYTLSYFQRELPYILEKIPFLRVVLVNGSWKYLFHMSPAYYLLAARGTPYDMVSPFTDEAEARAYEANTDKEIEKKWGDPLLFRGRDGRYSETELVRMASATAKRSYDYNFQTGLALARQVEGTHQYDALIVSFNRVVPFQTYAMLYGASREKYFSAANDANHYDAVHAEVALMTNYVKYLEQTPLNQRKVKSLAGTTLFINLMPCPSCARMFTQTDIGEFVYSIDHSDGYAIKMLEAAGKKVRRVVV